MKAKILIELDEEHLKRLVVREIESFLGEDIELSTKDVTIEVKSKQNYKSEWEVAAFRATYKNYLS
jgi:hypothetical protein